MLSLQHRGLPQEFWFQNPALRPMPPCFPVEPNYWFALQAFQAQFPFGLQYPAAATAPKKRFQDFDYFIVIDFEATCEKDTVLNPQEIIEFPSVIVNSRTGQIESCFQTYVRPTVNQTLSEFCKELTGIQQNQVDEGISLNHALIEHDNWLKSRGITNFAVVTWCNWDCKVMLQSECLLKNITKPAYFNRWINLRKPFAKVFGEASNLKEAIEKAGLSWEGRAHCGLDDAKNTANLLVQIMKKGFKFAITNTLEDGKFTSVSPMLEKQDVSPMLEAQDSVVPNCYCGVRCSQYRKWKPDGSEGCMWYGCGNWAPRGAPRRGSHCRFDKWCSY